MFGSVADLNCYLKSLQYLLIGHCALSPYLQENVLNMSQTLPNSILIFDMFFFKPWRFPSLKQLCIIFSNRKVCNKKLNSWLRKKKEMNFNRFALFSTCSISL